MVDIAQLKEEIEVTKSKINALEKESYKINSELKKNKKKLDKLISKINTVDGNCYYVYIVFVDGVPKYVGKGKGDRYKHAVSGASSVAELNKDLFMDKHIEVRILYGNKELTEEKALEYEKDCIGSLIGIFDIYNKDLPKQEDISFMDCDFYEYSDFAISSKNYKLKREINESTDC